MRPDEQRPAAYVHKSNASTLPSQVLIPVLRDVLGKGASFRFYAGGWSMEPFVKNGDILTVTPVKGRLVLGEVVAFVHPENDHLTVHRIIGRRNDACEMKGDNTRNSDGLVPRANILGRISRVERANRSVHCGLGIEKAVIALASRMNLLVYINRTIYHVSKFMRKIMSWH